MPPRLPSIGLAAAVYVGISLILALFARPGASPAMSAVIGLVGCLFMIAIGAVAVWHYTSTHGLTIPGGTGAGMGAGAVALGVIVAALVNLLLVAAGVIPDPQQAALLEMERQGLPDEQIEMAMRFANPLIGTAIGLVLGALMGAIGGAIGAAVFKRGGAEPQPI
jgi:hypothetical protein